MQTRFLLSAFAAFATSLVSAQVNRTATNGWGSTPSQRHYINATQALCVINAAVAFSDSIGYVPIPTRTTETPS